MAGKRQIYRGGKEWGNEMLQLSQPKEPTSLNLYRSFPKLTVHNYGYRPVVNQLYLHVSTELTTFYSPLRHIAHLFEKVVVQRNCFFRSWLPL